MPIKKRNFQTRSSNLVFVDDGVLVVRTPPECSRWDQGFRLRVIRDYVPPKSLKATYEYMQRFGKFPQKQQYRIDGHTVMVQQPHQPLDNNPRYTVVLRTEVIDLDNGRAMMLYHDDPAMRVLMVWTFLHRMHISGVPAFEVYPFPAA